jgi:hypothetical protein
MLLVLSNNTNQKEDPTMNKRLLALTVSSTLLLNSFQMAMASTPVAGEMSEAKLQEMYDSKASPKTTAELAQTLVEIQNLMTTLKKMNDTNESDVFLNYASKIQMALLAISSASMYAHLTKTEASNVKLGTSVAALLLNKFIEYRKEHRTLDPKAISAKIIETSNQISQMDGVPADVLKVKQELNALTLDLLKNEGDLQNIVKGLSGSSSDLILAANVAYLVLHVAYPKLAKEADGLLKNKALQKALELGQKPTAALGTTSGITGVTDLVSATLGMNSEKSRNLVTTTLINLDTAASNLKFEIQDRRNK